MRKIIYLHVKTSIPKNIWWLFWNIEEFGKDGSVHDFKRYWTLSCYSEVCGGRGECQDTILLFSRFQLTRCGSRTISNCFEKCFHKIMRSSSSHFCTNILNWANLWYYERAGLSSFLLHSADLGWSLSGSWDTGGSVKMIVQFQKKRLGRQTY